MTTKERIEEKIRKHHKSNKITKLVGYFGMSLIFGFMILFLQLASIDAVESRAVDYKFENTGKNDVQIWTNEKSYEMTNWIYAQYSENFESVQTINFVLVLSSLFISMVIMIIYLPLFGTNDRWYYDEFELSFTINGKKTMVNGKDNEKIIRALRINKIEDLGDTYKFKASMYYLIGVPGTEEFEVEKWKVTPKINKWIWF